MSHIKSRQEVLEPQRMRYVRLQLEAIGVQIVYADDKRLEFIHKENKVQVFPYSGWCTGKGITDCRGIRNLINQLLKDKINATS